MFKKWLVVGLLVAAGCDPRTYSSEPQAKSSAPVPQPPAVPDPGAVSVPAAAPATVGAKGASKHVVLELRGSIKELPGAFDFGGGPGKTLRDVVARIDRLAGNPEVKSIMVRISPLSVGMASAEEVRAALVRAGKRGKQVACHLETGGNVEYLVATACPQISIAPAGDLMLIGPHVEAMFVKGLLAKVGVVADFEHQGRFKGAADTLQRDTMSEEQRETMNALLDGATTRIVTAIAESRRISVADAKTIFDRAPFSAVTAKSAKLVDRLETFEQFRNGITKGGEWTSATADEPKKALPNLFDLFAGGKPEGPKGKRIAVVYMVGEIVHGSGGGGWIPSQQVASREQVAELERLAADTDVKAVVLRIDSPGGSALASDIIWHSVRNIAAKKPVIASMGDVAASGGYYIASAADRIFAQPDTITGSIGVIGGKLVLGGLYEKLGIKKEILTRGARGALFTEARMFTPDERAVISAMMKDVYGQFIDRVAQGRKMSKSSVEPIAQGRVWSGADALSRKLVDQLGGLDDAIAAARSKAKLGADSAIEFWPPPPTIADLVNRFGGGGGSDARLSLMLQVLGQLGETPLAALDIFSALTRFNTDHVQALLPIAIEIR